MSFFTKGLAGIFNNGKARKKDEGKGSDKKKGTKDEGSWEELTDVYGRKYWQHSKTGEWHFGYGGGFVPPVGTVNPSPMGYPGGPVFTPSPVPGGTLFPVAVAAPPAKKKEKKEKGKGWWETMYNEDGDKYWEHTVTKKTTYKDPYY
ncbi:unnamed protein product [Ectocarpus sp. 13 AM-2016]